jgi:UDP-N-acetylglucosamine--N-acetylmuramyl-(pentapeptide) pyrophosphoryl-undecaprenol N-acetylglucosamine transferase
MRIVFTGGGTGGHFYPCIAIAEELRGESASRGEKLDLYYFATSAYNQNLLDANAISFVYVPAGKWRRYFSLKNIVDLFRTATGVIIAFFRLLFIYPDVIFGKGGYVSFPTLLAARLLFIPIIIHESDAKPGRVNTWAASFATRIAVSYQEASLHFPKEKVAWTGQPLRLSVTKESKNRALEYFQFKENVPTIALLGGSQGAVRLNEGLLDALPKLLPLFQIIHQTGEKNFKDVTDRTSIILEKEPNKERYKAFPYLSAEAMGAVAGAADVVITRAGSTVFELAHWRIPAIIIPIPSEISHDQESNAYAYGRTGAAIVIEESNFTPNLLLSELNRIVLNTPEKENMIKAAALFDRPDAAKVISQSIRDLAENHV